MGDANPNTVTSGDNYFFLYGGDDDATSTFSGVVYMEGGDGFDYLSLGDGKIAGQSGYIFGGAGRGTFVGSVGADYIADGDESSLMLGGAFLTHTYSFGAVTLYEFVDDPVHASGADILIGGGSPDAIYGFDGDDFIYGGGGSDWQGIGFRLPGVSGFVEAVGGLFGGDGNDYVYGGFGDDGCYGGAGDDYVDGGLQADTVQGDEGNDILMAGDGDDHVYGGLGNDYLYGGAGNDIIDGGYYDITYNLTGGADVVFGGSGDDQIAAYSSIDVETQVVSGDDGNDTIYSGSGADWLFGGSGNDAIAGGAGNDYIASGGGNDYLHGGEGTDYFDVSDALSGGTFDLVLDFSFETDCFLVPTAYEGAIYYSMSGGYVWGSISTSSGYYSFGAPGLSVAQLQASVFFI